MSNMPIKLSSTQISGHITEVNTMPIDYNAIGHRIRKLRQSKKMTQDELRLKIDISKTHMSHIETGSTKLSLPILIDIANALETSVDYLLSDSINTSTHVFRDDMEKILSDCTPYEYRALIKSMELTKSLIRNIPTTKEQYPAL